MRAAQVQAGNYLEAYQWPARGVHICMIDLLIRAEEFGRIAPEFSKQGLK